MTKKFEDQLDENIKDSLISETNEALELKDEIWNRIEARIIQDEAHKTEDKEDRVKNFRREKRKMKTQNQKRKRLISVGTVAAALIFVFLVGTAPGHAAIDRIRELFAPEKTITEELEGTKEEKNVQLQPSKLGYIIYIDEEMFELEKLENSDRILPINRAENLPEIFMEIQQVENKDINALATEIEGKMKEEFETVINHGAVETPVKGLRLYGQKGNKWDDIVVRYYLVDNNQGGTFLIKQQFFLEATEGFGARFENMLREFQIIEVDK